MPRRVTVRRVTGRDSAAGFTLLEVLVMLVVLGLLLAGLSQGLRFGLLAWRTEARLQAAHGELDALDRTFRHLVETLEPGTVTTPSSLRGEAGRVSFTATLPAAARALPTRLADVTLYLDGAHRLVLDWTPHRHAVRVGAPPMPVEEVLLRGVAAVRLAYAASSGGGWQDSWTSPYPPALIRLRLVFPAGDPRRWPDLVAAPRRDRVGE